MKTLLAAAIALCSALSAEGVVLLTYDFQTTGTTNDAVSANSTISPTPNYTVSALTAGEGL